MDKVRVTIAIDEAHLDQLDDVADQLKAAGLDIEQTLSTLGIVSGAVARDKMSSLSQVSGVESIEVDRRYQLNPPGSEVQ